MYTAWTSIRRRAFAVVSGDFAPSSGEAGQGGGSATGSSSGTGGGGAVPQSSPRPLRAAEWLTPLLHEASLDQRLAEARAWAESTGCLERDLLDDDDAADDLSQRMRLKKFEFKRLRRAVAKRRETLGLPVVPPPSGTAAGSSASARPSRASAARLLGACAAAPLAVACLLPSGISLIFKGCAAGLGFLQSQALALASQTDLGAARVVAVLVEAFPWILGASAAGGKLLRDSSVHLGTVLEVVKETFSFVSTFKVEFDNSITWIHVAFVLLFSVPVVVGVHLCADAAEIRKNGACLLICSYVFGIALVGSAHVLLHYSYFNGLGQATASLHAGGVQFLAQVRAFLRYIYLPALDPFSMPGLVILLVTSLLVLGLLARRAARQHERADAGSAAQSRLCIICMGKPSEATFVHNGTGHTCACMGCAQIVMRRKDSCPMCRLPIESVIHNYT
mmetsp:Transcript_40865/g.131428  ORF Transcript_40865/g.131428 Transcript_40865/m.131428 type:complete len:449 (-) Transcript_40865:8-1354(-)